MTLSNLRRKLGVVGAGSHIITLPGRGYMLRVES
jgi:DNA-binding winged helix-turn-helix (wHTH) protein